MAENNKRDEWSIFDLLAPKENCQTIDVGATGPGEWDAQEVQLPFDEILAQDLKRGFWTLVMYAPDDEECLPYLPTGGRAASTASILKEGFTERLDELKEKDPAHCTRAICTLTKAFHQAACANIPEGKVRTETCEEIGVIGYEEYSRRTGG